MEKKQVSMSRWVITLMCMLPILTLKAQTTGGWPDAIKEAFRQQRMDLLKPYFSSDYRVGIYSGDRAFRLATKVVETYGYAEETTIRTKTKTRDGYKFDVEMAFKNTAPFTTEVFTNRMGQVTRIRMIDQLYRYDVVGKSKFVASIPFELIDSRIIVKLRINNHPKILTMLFDTGADGVGLKKSIAQSLRIQTDARQHTQVVGASMEIETSRNNTLVFDTTRITGQTIAIFPDFQDNIDGLLGGNILKSYLTEISFDHQLINLYTFGDSEQHKTGKTIPMEFEGIIPAIKTEIELNNGKETNATLHFDTGAKYPVILFSHFVNAHKLTENFKVESSGNTWSMGNTTPTTSGKFNRLQFPNVTLKNFTGTLQTASAIKKGMADEAHGSMGIEIIKRYNWVIDVSNRVYTITTTKCKN